MEAAPSVKLRRDSPPIPPNYVSLRQLRDSPPIPPNPVSIRQLRDSPPTPPNYVSLRQLQELRLSDKEEQQRKEAAAAAAVTTVKREAARKVEMETVAAARKPDSAVVPLVPVRAKERRDGQAGLQWVAVAPRPVVPPPALREAVPDEVPIGVGRGPADALRGGGKPARKGKEKVSAATSEQTRTTDEPGKTADASSHGGKPENKGEGKGKSKKTASGSIGGSGGSAGASSQRRKSAKWKKCAGGRSAGPSAETAGASAPRGVNLENGGKPKSPGRKRADAAPVSDSSHGKKADATPVPPTSAAAAGVVSESAGTKPEGLAEGQRRPPAVEVQRAAEQKPRVVRRRAWPRMWVPKAAPAAGCDEL